MKDWQKYGLVFLLAYYVSPEVRNLTRINFRPLADILDKLLFPVPPTPAVTITLPTVPGLGVPEAVFSAEHPETLGTPGIESVLAE